VLDTVADLREPVGAGHPLRVAELVARLGGNPVDEESIASFEPQVLAELGAGARPPGRTKDPDPRSGSRAESCNVLTGWGSGAVTTPTSPSVPRLRRQRAGTRGRVGEALIGAGLLLQKPSVGSDTST